MNDGLWDRVRGLDSETMFYHSTLNGLLTTLLLQNALLLKGRQGGVCYLTKFLVNQADQCYHFLEALEMSSRVALSVISPSYIGSGKYSGWIS